LIDANANRLFLSRFYNICEIWSELKTGEGYRSTSAAAKNCGAEHDTE